MKKRCKLFAIFFALTGSVYSAHAQYGKMPDTVIKKWVGLTPVNKHTKIKALALGITPAFGFADEGYINMNGLNLEVGPFGIIGGIWGMMYGLAGVKDSSGHTASFFSRYGYPDTSELHYIKYGTTINELSASMGGLTVVSVNNGVFINGLAGMNYMSNGIQVSGLINALHKFNGVLIGGFANKAQKGNGLMIGLINNCQSGNLVQIGLFNRIGRRVIPFINCGFK
ncbi:MAG: hypothetical protein KF746_16875 [Chitinophagaceae bacterium]|nr:hypothetical protein [Chitinophagaceae bacterium]